MPMTPLKGDAENLAAINVFVEELRRRSARLELGARLAARRYVTTKVIQNRFVQNKRATNVGADILRLRDPVKELEWMDRESSRETPDEVPPVPEDVAARDEGGPSMGERLRRDQDETGERETP